MAKGKNDISGWLVLDKPLNMSSAHAVDVVKRIMRPMKIGHAGTLDPLATGILPLALGEATKLSQFGMDSSKAYSFEVTWGAERDSDDMEGEVTITSEKRPSQAEIEALLPQFVGLIQQAPPAYSAIKIDGKRAYAMARAGEAPEMKLREVRVDSLTIVHHDLDRTVFHCECGKGTYIRSLGRDMGRVLGCYGHISMLRRTRVGNFSENDAISLEKLEEIVHKGDLGLLKPPQAMLDDILAINLSEAEAALLMRGMPITNPSQLADESLVVCEKDGVLVAMAKVSGSSVKPIRVFNLLKMESYDVE